MRAHEQRHSEKKTFLGLSESQPAETSPRKATYSFAQVVYAE
jgi:hypothetical protein